MSNAGAIVGAVITCLIVVGCCIACCVCWGKICSKEKRVVQPVIVERPVSLIYSEEYQITRY